jgi:hypothetical protein
MRRAGRASGSPAERLPAVPRAGQIGGSLRPGLALSD